MSSRCLPCAIESDTYRTIQGGCIRRHVPILGTRIMQLKPPMPQTTCTLCILCTCRKESNFNPEFQSLLSFSILSWMVFGSRYWDESDELSLLVVSRPQAPSSQHAANQLQPRLRTDVARELPLGCFVMRHCSLSWFDQISAGWWFETSIFYFPRNIGNVIVPIDELIFFTGVQSTNQIQNC